MKKLFLFSLLLAAHFSLTALVPLQPGDPQPPWWVGGRLIWPFAVETRTLIQGDLLNTFTPMLAFTSAIAFLLAAAALLRRLVPSNWMPGLVAAGAVLSILLQVIWFSAWAIFPILVSAVLLWASIRRRGTVENSPAYAGLEELKRSN
jgi:hypothetical protein